MVENYPVRGNSINYTSSWSKNNWIYNSNNNYVWMATKKDYFPKNSLKNSNFWNIFIVFRLTKILSSSYLPQPGSSMATRRSSRSSSTDSLQTAASYVVGDKAKKGESQNGCFKKPKQTKFFEKRTFFTPWYTHDVKRYEFAETKGT